MCVWLCVCLCIFVCICLSAHSLKSMNYSWPWMRMCDSVCLFVCALERITNMYVLIAESSLPVAMETTHSLYSVGICAIACFVYQMYWYWSVNFWVDCYLKKNQEYVCLSVCLSTSLKWTLDNPGCECVTVYSLIAQTSLPVAMETTRLNCSTCILLGYVPVCFFVCQPACFRCFASLRKTKGYHSVALYF